MNEIQMFKYQYTPLLLSHRTLASAVLWMSNDCDLSLCPLNNRGHIMRLNHLHPETIPKLLLC